MKNINMFAFNAFLTEAEWRHAVKLWQEGSDTKQIAAVFQCRESLIYSKLPHYRAKYKGIDEAAA